MCHLSLLHTRRLLPGETAAADLYMFLPLYIQEHEQSIQGHHAVNSCLRYNVERQYADIHYSRR